MAEKSGGTFVPFPAGKPDRKPGKARGAPQTSTTEPKPHDDVVTPADIVTPPPWTGGDGGKGWAY